MVNVPICINPIHRPAITNITLCMQTGIPLFSLISNNDLCGNKGFEQIADDRVYLCCVILTDHLDKRTVTNLTDTLSSHAGYDLDEGVTVALFL